VLERIAMASPGGGSAFKPSKRRASNTPLDSRPAKKNRGVHEGRKPHDDRDSGIATEDDDDSEAEREEVKQCLLRPVTPSPAAQQHRVTSTAFNTVPRALIPRPQSYDRSPSPTPTRTQHNRTQSRKRKGVFMDAVEVPTHKPQHQAPRRSRPRRRCASLHMTDQPITTDAATTISAADEEATPLSGTSSGPAVRRSLRRAKSLVGPTSTDITAVRSTLAQKAGRRQRASVAATKTKAKAKSIAKKATNAFAQSGDESDEDVVGAIAGPSLSSSSPISASLKRARVLFGSGKCQVSLFFWVVWLIDGPCLHPRDRYR
jgi:hypothetical protein